MSRRSSSLNNYTGTGITREIDSKYDVIKEVSNYLPDIEAINLVDIPALTEALNEAKNFTGITVVTGEVANWDEVSKTLTVPTLQGVQGIQGVQGEVGSAGPTGARGAKGDQGVQGEQGIQGAPGLQGAQGPEGEKGDKGDTGAQGAVGPIGPVGPNGDDGTDGDKGDQGISVHHIKGTNTTDPEGDFGTFSELDTYTLYGDADEMLNIGHFVIRQGVNAVGGEALGYMRRVTYDTNNSGVVDDSEALGGKSLAVIEAERTAEINAAKLALGTNYTVVDNTAKDALVGLTVSDKVFVQDDGDGKWAQYWVVAVTDGLGSTSTFEVAMDEDTYLNANTAASVKSTYESNTDTNAYTDAEQAKVGRISVTQTVDLDTIESDTDLNNVHRTSDGSDHTFIDQDVTTSATPTFAGISTSGLVDGRDVSVDGAKLDTIENGATADQTAGEIESLYEGQANTNKYTDAEQVKVSYVSVTQPVNLDTIENDTNLNNTHRNSSGSDHTFIDQDVTTTSTPTFAGIVTAGLVDGRDVSVDGAKLDTIESNAKDDQIADEVPYSNTASGLSATSVQDAVDEVEGRLDTAENKLSGIENNATADQTAAEIEGLYEGQSNTNKYTDADKAFVDVSTPLTTVATSLSQAVNELVAIDANHNNRINANTSNILALAGSNAIGSFENTAIDLTLTGTPQTLTWAVKQQSNNIDKFELNNNNTITIKSEGTYIFTSTITFEDNTNAGLVGAVLFNVTDGTTSYYTQTETIEIENYARDTVPFNSVLTVDGSVSLPVTVRVDASISGETGVSGDYAVVGLSSILTSEKAVGELSSLANDVTVSPVGNLTSSDVQAALEELQADVDTRLLATAKAVDADKLDGQDSTYYRNASNINAGTINDTYLPATITSNITGNAATATKLATARTVSLSGDVSGSAVFDGTSNINITAVIADDSHNHTIANVDGLQTALDGKVDDAQVLTNVPAGAVFTDTTYSDAEIKVKYENNLNTNAFTDTEKTKLAGVEEGATQDMTASEILTAVKTVDGMTSGLDADLLDGKEGASYEEYARQMAIALG